MVNLISLERVSISYGLKTLLDEVSLGVQEGDRIGVVGLNGGGKTTLLEVLTKHIAPDSGRVAHNSQLRMAVVTQRFTVDPSKTIGQVVLGQRTEFDWASDAKIRDVLAGLGVAALGLDTPVGQLSGGEQRRVGLAAALVEELDLVVLDEPTNHLDVEGVQWLADHLLSRRIAVVVVTHDRWFLDTVATTTWEVHDGHVDTYEGGYNDWTFARAERARQADAAEARRQNLARKELAWLRRGAPARTSKPRYRIEAAEALIQDVPEPRDSVELMAFSRSRQGKIVVELEDASLETPDGRPLLEDVTWRLAPGERIGLVGVNGSGKTTLLRAIAGEYPLSAGRRKEGKTMKLGWLRQHLDDIDPDQRVLDSIQDIASHIQVGKKELSASQLAERLGFPVKRQRTPIRDLSGGERRRLQLTRVLMSEPNLLLLDEPTNDLDIDTLQELENLLDSWPGTLIVISHDRYLVERIADSTWALFGDGQLTNLPGGIPQYLQRRQQQAQVEDRGHEGVKEASRKTVGSSADEEQQKISAKEFRELNKKMRALDKKIAQAAAQVEKVQAQLAEVASELPVDTEKLTSLDAALRQAQQEQEELENEWLELGEQLQ